MTEKTVYLIVSDLHICYKNFTSRVNYREETVFVLSKMLEIAKKYKDNGYEVKLILLGDVFHGSYNDVFNAVTDNNFFITWKNKIGDIYSVLGNHELHFYSANPFYTLVSQIDSKKVQSIMNCVWTPVGTTNAIMVPDTLTDGNVIFHFNHYGTRVDRVEKDNQIHIGLFHQEIVNQQILDSMQAKLASNIWAKTMDVEGSDLFDNYSYCFMGHMHKVYGKYLLDSGCYVDYLASLGRTNVSEVLDSFLERDIPAVLIENQNFCRIESNKFLLPERSLCVKEDIVIENQRKYEIIKERKEVKLYEGLSDNPITNLKNYFADSPRVLSLIDELLQSDIDSRGYDLKNRVRRELLL